MIEQKFAVALLGVTPPCYVRMVDRASDCGIKEDSLQIRAQVIHDRLLATGEDGAISLWLVRDAIDLARVALALNSTRVSLTTEILFFAIEPSRLQDRELQCTEGSVDCVWAKRQHRDLTLRSERRRELSQAFADTKRRAKRFSESNEVCCRRGSQRPLLFGCQFRLSRSALSLRGCFESRRKQLFDVEALNALPLYAASSRRLGPRIGASCHYRESAPRL
jgi:hypothetical protein